MMIIVPKNVRLSLIPEVSLLTFLESKNYADSHKIMQS